MLIRSAIFLATFGTKIQLKPTCIFGENQTLTSEKFNLIFNFTANYVIFWTQLSPHLEHGILNSRHQQMTERFIVQVGSHSLHLCPTPRGRKKMVHQREKPLRYYTTGTKLLGMEFTMST
jgi:hypothetical protein